MTAPVPRPPDRLEFRGLSLWLEVTAGPGRLGPIELALLTEACRIVDRLERLDQFLAGTGTEWVRLAEEIEGRGEVAIVVDQALGEARQQAGRLTSIAAELRLRTAGSAAGVGRPAPPAPGPAEVPTGVASILGRARGRTAAG
ncbi:hypothetical protein GCM10010112_87030 [Actinoplanes lobatus]|uniref:Uncharacterized protein n=1 Tax=Actinoplanes lobatus TaxID=113568 RepID=A0A7W7HC12_9ACTN|nr:hypothetical protein [Actinoplanes lobatus]MBB4747760.1 hypothetical protein [Actinoplanes lobatus]GGN96089.1 hypothetical protein GCM10010112_87030 [Actinoplanes lobatus]GIE45167.1 hypothetical protein Alo02nite_80650 [Actinoplanes lobatus]